MFPTISFNFYILMNLFNVNYIALNKFLYFSTNKDINKLLIFLNNINYINNFSKTYKTKYSIEFYYYNTLPIFNKFKFISKPSKSIYISYQNLLKLSKISMNSLYLISTNQGFLDQNEAIKLKLGGELLLYFYN